VCEGHKQKEQETNRDHFLSNYENGGGRRRGETESKRRARQETRGIIRWDKRREEEAVDMGTD
jgi:hypothetical protein